MSETTNQPDKEPESRDRPASVESTAGRAVFYKKLRNVLVAGFLVLWLLMMLLSYPDLPILGIPSPLYGVLPGGATLTILMGMGLVGSIIILGKKARRHAQPRFIDLDSPPGVLYLRPFSEDTDFRVYASWGSDRHTPWGPGGLALLKFRLRMQFRGINEFGEILSELTRDVGSVAAIGEPASPPILGADNVYVSDDGWQEKVLALATGAELVILTAGTTPGVLWETENMIRVVPPSRLLLNIPGTTLARRRKHYAAFREAAGGLFPRGLPAELKRRVITFEDDWTPVADPKHQGPAGTSANLAWWLSRVLP
jgi:hypothetical protein